MRNDKKNREQPLYGNVGVVQRLTIIGIGMLVFLLLSGCQAVTPQEEILNYQTILAMTPSATASPTATVPPTQTPMPTLPPTQTPTASPTPEPSPTPLPPTPNPNPALKNFTFCRQEAGDSESGRFSARATGVITTERFPAFERVLLDIDPAPDSAPLSAEAYLLSERDFTLMTGEPSAPAPYVLVVNLPSWLHDERFATSALTRTVALSGTDVVQSVSLSFDPSTNAGAEMLLALKEPVIYDISFSRDMQQLRVGVALPSAMYTPPDTLATPAGTGPGELPAPLFFLSDGDVWRIDSTGAISLTQSPEEETALTVSSDGSMVAFCRAQEPGFSPYESSAPIPGSLWVMQSDGTNVHRISDAVVNCADPAFSPDGSLIAFGGDETGVAPARERITILPVVALTFISDTLPLTGTGVVTSTGLLAPAVPPTLSNGSFVVDGGGWNRSGARWVDTTTLVYAANSPDTRATLFLLDLATGKEQDIGAALQVADNDYRYHGFGKPLVSPTGRVIAVEALRADAPGADVLLLDAQGKEQDVLDKGFWTRPLAWGADGTLYYLTTRCASTFAQNYELHALDALGSDTLVATGVSFGTIGEVTGVGDGLAYVVASRALPGFRGTNTAAPSSPSAIWYWNLQDQTRDELLAVPHGIHGLTR